MVVFCPKCGKNNKIETLFCRGCGYELPEFTKNLKKSEEVKSRIKNVNTTNSVITSTASLICTLIAVYYAFNNISDSKSFIFSLVIISLVFLVSTFLSLQSNYYLKKAKLTDEDYINFTQSKNTEFLKEADFTDFISTSVTENTTKKLKEKIINK
jgi:hypothetical protein